MPRRVLERSANSRESPPPMKSRMPWLILDTASTTLEQSIDRIIVLLLEKNLLGRDPESRPFS